MPPLLSSSAAITGPVLPLQSFLNQNLLIHLSFVFSVVLILSAPAEVSVYHRILLIYIFLIFSFPSYRGSFSSIFFSCKWDIYDLIPFGTGIKSALFYDAKAAFPCCLSSSTLYSCTDIAYPWGGSFWHAKCIAMLTLTGGSCS